MTKETKKPQSKKRPKAPQVHVEVNDEQIRQAIQRDSQHCMIADAIRVAQPKASKIAVDLATIRFTDPEKGLRYTYLTPRLAQVELVKFDQGLPTVPFDFLLRAGHVTVAGSRKSKRTDAQAVEMATSLLDELGLEKPKNVGGSNEGRSKGGKVSAQKKALRKATMRFGKSKVPDRTGGTPLPLQKTKDGVPFTRRRAFGLRGLEF